MFIVLIYWGVDKKQLYDFIVLLSTLMEFSPHFGLIKKRIFMILK